MTEIELLVFIRDRLNLLLSTADKITTDLGLDGFVNNDCPDICNEILKEIEKHLGEQANG